MTTHRAVTILWPHTAGDKCTTLRARGCVFAIALVFVLMTSHIIYGRSIKETPSGEKICTFVYQEYMMLLYHTFWWIHTTTSSVIPFFLLIVSNSAIIYTVAQSLRQARETLTVDSTNQLNTRESKASSMSVTLVCASMAFLILTMPLLAAIPAREFGGAYHTDVKSRALSVFIDTVHTRQT